MVRIGFAFPSGRYHATPWGRHVNEGAVEWPPSPWRIIRALLATGFTRLQWTEGALPEDGRELLLQLAGVVPRYFLPPAGSGHSRHYMPKYDETTTKVFDTFAYLGRAADAQIVVEYPVDLPDARRAVLSSLVGSLPYLGRAESWVSASLVEELPPGLSPCVSSETSPGPGLERVQLLAPISDTEYGRWRDEHAAPSAGKVVDSRRRKRGGTSSDSYPGTLLDALCTDTRTLQKQGWSQPPGTRWLSYWISAEALSERPPRARTPKRAGGHQAAVLAVASNTVQREVLPLLTGGVRYAEALHRALVKRSEVTGRVPACFTGKDHTGNRILHHQHASIFPLSLDHRGSAMPRIDHFLVWCPMTFDVSAEGAIEQVQRIWAKDLPEQFLTLVGFGDRAEFARLIHHLQPATVWKSCMPYVAPRFLKRRGRNTLDGQVRAELCSLGLPDPVRIEVELEGASHVDASVLDGSALDGQLGRLATRWRWFKRRRLHPGRQPPPQGAFGLRITFAAPVAGPIALGYGSHFGLGLMTPEANQP